MVTMKNSNHVLTAENLHKQYGKRWVVRAVDIEVKKGEIVGLLGPNGAGKTTTFYMITGMIKPTKGRIFLDKKEITQDAMYKRSRQGIGYLAQEPSIFGKLLIAIPFGTPFLGQLAILLNLANTINIHILLALMPAAIPIYCIRNSLWKLHHGLPVQIKQRLITRKFK